jgi:hypothetical protein
MIPAMVIWTITLKVESNTLTGPKYQRRFDYGHENDFIPFGFGIQSQDTRISLFFSAS